MSLPNMGPLADEENDGNLDLSLMQLTRVPVSEIALVQKAKSLDLSNNLLSYLPDDFPTLTHLVKLDLSKNQLEELPEYFGHLKNLKHLDLYSNKISKLPLSFSQLKNLQWLDLTKNPLAPALQQAAGPCITPSDCKLCAKKVTALLQELQDKMEKDREILIIKQQKIEEQRQQEKREAKERIKNQKKAAKEDRKRQGLQANANKSDGPAGAVDEGALGKARAVAAEEFRNGENQSGSSSSFWSRRSYSSKEQHGTEASKTRPSIKCKAGEEKSSGGRCWKLGLFLFSLLLLTVGTGVSLVWIYAGGNLDQASVERALPILMRDLNASVGSSSKKAAEYVELCRSWAGPRLTWLKEELERRNDLVAQFINQQLSSPEVCGLIKWSRSRWADALANAEHFWSYAVRPALLLAADHSRRTFDTVVEFSKTHLNTEALWSYWMDAALSLGIVPAGDTSGDQQDPTRCGSIEEGQQVDNQRGLEWRDKQLEVYAKIFESAIDG